MTARIEQLPSDLVNAGLQALRAAAPAAALTAAGGHALLAHARALAEAWRVAAGVTQPETDDADAAQEMALRFIHDDGLVEIDCMADDAEVQLAAQWQSAVPIHLSLRIGDSLWIEHADAQGMQVFDSAGLMQSPGDRARFERIGERAQAELERWRRLHPDTHWSCPQCAFRNAAQDRICSICGGDAAGTSPTRRNEVLRQRSLPPLGQIEPLRSGIELPLPEGLADLIGELGGLAALLAAQPTAALVDLWLLACDEARKSTLMRALIDARAAAGLTPNALTDVLQLAGSLPACVGPALSGDAAARMQSQLVAAGARVEIRSHSSAGGEPP